MRRFLHNLSALFGVRSLDASDGKPARWDRTVAPLPRRERRRNEALDRQAGRRLHRKSDDSRPIFLNANSVGPRVVDYVPELRDVLGDDAGKLFEYSNPNDETSSVGMGIREQIARLESVTPDNVRIGGSGLALIERLPSVLDRESIVTFEGDFSGYHRDGALCGRRHVQVPNSLDQDQNKADPAVLAATLKDLSKPILFVGVPCLNPYPTDTSLDLIKRALDANPDLIVVADGAYLRFAGSREDYASFAADNDRALYLNVAAKDVGACAARVCWLIAREDFLARIAPAIQPFEPSVFGQEAVLALLRNPALVERTMQVQRQAHTILINGIADLGLNIRAGKGPWVLVELGKRALEIVEILRRGGPVVQLQNGIQPTLQNWIRVSASVPDEAQRFVDSLSCLLSRYPEIPQLKLDSKGSRS